MRRLLFCSFVLLAFAAIPARSQTVKTCNTSSCTGTVTVRWTPSTDTNTTQNIYRETSSGACTVASAGTGPGCWKLNATPLANTVTTFTDTLSSTCAQDSASCSKL